MKALNSLVSELDSMLLEVRCMASSELVEVFVSHFLWVSFFDVCCVEGCSSIQKVTWACAGSVEPVKLTGDDTIFASGGKFGFWVRELVELQTFSHQFYSLVVELRVPRFVVPDGHVEIIYWWTFVFRVPQFQPGRVYRFSYSLECFCFDERIP